jgi:hypothetical protein
LKIPILAGPRIIGYCTSPLALKHLVLAPNIDEVVRARKSKDLVRIYLRGGGDDSDLRALGLNSRIPTYAERVATQQAAQPLKALKRVDIETGALVRWTCNDRFLQCRFNPDLMGNNERKRTPLRPPVAKSRLSRLRRFEHADRD